MKINDILLNEIGEKIPDAHGLFKKYNKALTTKDKELLKEMLKHEVVLIHGSSHKKYSEPTIVENKKDRLPTDTPEDIHEAVDKAMEKIFGYKFRSNALFVWNKHSIELIKAPSNKNIIVPKRPFKMLSSKDILDLYLFYKNEGSREFAQSGVVQKVFKDVLGAEDFKKIDRQEFNKLMKGYLKSLTGFTSVEYIQNALTHLQMQNDDLDDINTFQNAQAIAGKLLDLYKEYYKSNVEKIVKEHYYMTDKIADIPNREEREVMIHADKFLFLPLAPFRMPLQAETGMLDFNAAMIIEYILSPDKYLEDFDKDKK